MALELTLQKQRFNLGAVLQREWDVFNNVRQRDLLQKEKEFQRRVVDEGLDYEAQLEYRKGILKKLNEAPIKDQTAIDFQKDNISALRRLVRVERIRDKIANEYQQLTLKRKSINDYIKFLNNQMDNVIDEDVKDEIQTKIREAEVLKSNEENNILINNAKYAIEDKSVDKIQSVIDKINKKKNNLLAVGQAEAASAWDLSLQQLNGSLSQIKIENKMRDLQVKIMTEKKTSAKDMLDFYIKQTTAADTSDAKITIDGRTYDNEQQYWQFKLNDYLTDTTNGFFGLMKAEAENKLVTAYQKLTPMVKTELSNIKREFEDLKNKKELQPYLDTLEQIATSVYSNGAKLYGSKLLTDYTNKKLGKSVVDNYITATNEINEIAKEYNVDLSDIITKIQSDLAAKKQQAVGEFVNVVQSEINNPNSEYYQNPQAAFNAFSGSLRAYDVPTVDFAEKSIEDIAKNIVMGTEPKYEIGKEIPTTETQPVTEPAKQVTQEQEKIEKQKIKIPGPSYLNYYKESEIERTPEGDIYLKPGVDVRWKAPEKKEEKPIEVKPQVQPSIQKEEDTQKLNLRKVGPSEYENLRKKYKVGETNFGQYFVRKGNDIYAKPGTV